MKLNDCVALVLKQKGAAVFCIEPDVTVYEGLVRMAEKDIGALVVTRESKVVGIFSERDYVRKVILKGRSSKELKVHEIMSSPAPTVTSSTTVDECMRRITDERVRHLAVLEEGKLVGVVSIGDLVNWIITSQDRTIHQLEDYITGRYPA
ncbi:MAG: CBS domain-containing protein [Vicinamibacteria bacterium]